MALLSDVPSAYIILAMAIVFAWHIRNTNPLDR